MMNLVILSISNGWKTAIMMVALIVVFYFFMIRPQRIQAKKEQAYRDGLAKGDNVVTIGGIHGTVVSADAATVTVRVAENATMRMLKTSIVVPKA